MGSGDSAGTQAVILADPPPLVSESCQMIREPAQRLFGRNKQQHNPDELLAVNQKSKFNITVTNTNIPFLCSASVSSRYTNDIYIFIKPNLSLQKSGNFVKTVEKSN